ncbi:MAG: hypothetical protein AAF968_24795 [Pseudomonadota bacterium]
MTRFELGEVSAVDRPAQAPALAEIAKVADAATAGPYAELCKGDDVLAPHRDAFGHIADPTAALDALRERAGAATTKSNDGPSEAEADYWSAVAGLEASGLSRGAAIASVNRDQPELVEKAFG